MSALLFYLLQAKLTLCKQFGYLRLYPPTPHPLTNLRIYPLNNHNPPTHSSNISTHTLPPLYPPTPYPLTNPRIYPYITTHCHPYIHPHIATPISTHTTPPTTPTPTRTHWRSWEYAKQASRKSSLGFLEELESQIIQKTDYFLPSAVVCSGDIFDFPFIPE